MKRIRHKIVFLLFIIISALTVMFILKGEQILTYVGRKLIVVDEIKDADLIVALGGENIRKKEAVELFNKGYGKKILFTGFEIEKEDYYRYGLKDKDFIYPVRFLSNTYEEAVFTRDVALNKGYKSVIVVTSNYHTRRTSYIFKKLLEKEGIKVMVHQAVSKNLDLNKWWQTRFLRKIVIIEWVGLLYYMIEY
ncbi:MAG: YdcF family protein [Proteobacteria bacterium]|nr:YdcF family protein [Pseudomonadota bacterium]